ncbi:hypothetical protein CIT292_09999 [Citrobacter youngae ATCC 29220]|uniref:Uncharacterized protein n=1 Tax=Citrobacter youngae ATCC 29220 TaxID=500640 RepID=D4BHI6_9ENTR|nr:hypothetical protein CIT292_09999 [Citrobacter youngae ATCC 29220]
MGYLSYIKCVCIDHELLTVNDDFVVKRHLFWLHAKSFYCIYSF